MTRYEIDLGIFRIRQERQNYLKSKGSKLAVMRPEHLQEFCLNVFESLQVEASFSAEAQSFDQESLRFKRERRDAFRATLERKLQNIRLVLVNNPPKDEEEGARWSRRFDRIHAEIERCVPLPAVKKDASDA